MTILDIEVHQRRRRRSRRQLDEDVIGPCGTTYGLATACESSADNLASSSSCSSSKALSLSDGDKEDRAKNQHHDGAILKRSPRNRQSHRLAVYLLLVTELFFLYPTSLALLQPLPSTTTVTHNRSYLRRRPGKTCSISAYQRTGQVGVPSSSCNARPSTCFMSPSSISNGGSAAAVAAAAAAAASASTSNDKSQTNNNEGGIPVESYVMSNTQLSSMKSVNRAASSSSNNNNDNSNNLQGLSRSFQNMFSRSTTERQRFVTGQYPVIVSVRENPTLQWLNLGRSDISTAVVSINGTAIDRSLASYDRYQWLDDVERQELHDRYATVSIELLAEISLAKPGYLHILSSDGGPGSTASKILDQQRAAGRDDGPAFPFSWLQNQNQNQQQQQKEHQSHDSLFRHSVNGNMDHSQTLQDREKLWVTGFSLASRRGFIKSVDVNTGRIDSINSRSESMILWPNEVNHIPRTEYLAPARSITSPTTASQSTSVSSPPPPHPPQDGLLVSDGFLVPGKDRGGIYVVKNPSDDVSEWTIQLTNPVSRDQWFYHRAVWVDLTGDGRLSVLTARAKLRKVADDSSGRQQPVSDGDSQLVSRPRNGQLVWLEMPQPHHYDESTGTPLDKDGTVFDPFSSRHLPWKEHVLATGPDVMFAVADLDPNDDTIEVLASQFFDKKVTLQSIKLGLKPHVTFSRVIDDRCGAAFGGILADLDTGGSKSPHRVVDSGSTVSSLDYGDSFSHLLVTSHECDYDSSDDDKLSSFGLNEHSMDSKQSVQHNSGRSQESIQGGSLFAYRVPTTHRDAWKTEPWTRTTVATGFRVRSQLWNVINPGAPGFCYTFHAHKDDSSKGKRPFIAIAGDCAESAFIYRPDDDDNQGVSNPYTDSSAEDKNARYKLMCEIECGATVGSIAVGYDDLCDAEQESGYAKIYIPSFERDKILVFALGSGEEDSAYEEFEELDPKTSSEF